MNNRIYSESDNSFYSLVVTTKTPCKQADPEIWQPIPETVKGRPSKEAKVAKELCETCPIMKECLAYALENNEQLGIWGGQTTDERYELSEKVAS